MWQIGLALLPSMAAGIWRYWSNICAWFHARQRRMDVKWLWPECKAVAEERLGYESLDLARSMFWLHTQGDPAWLSLGQVELSRQVDALA